METSNHMARLLAANPFFAGLAPDALEQIAAICVGRKLAAREVLFLKGDPADGLFAIRRGQIRIGTTDEQGRRITMNVLGSGDVFGEIALLDGRPRTADAAAIEDTDMFFVPRREFLHLLRRESSIAVQLIELLCARLRAMSERMEDNAFLPLSARLARRIVALAEDYGAELHVSQEELASFAGVTRESVNRQLQRWKQTGLVELGRGRLVIADSERLARLAEGEASPATPLRAGKD